MKRAFFLSSLLVAGVIVVLSGCGSGTSTGGNTSGAASTPVHASSTSTTTASASLMVSTSAPLGQFRVDGSGRTLYLFEADTGAASTCSGACAKAWPPLLTSGQPTVSGAAQQSLVGTVKRSDGTTQVTYNGHPLYYFVGDKKAGDTSGEGINAFGGGWDVVSPAGNKIEKPGS
jgi:predicted lipoprotein with Yx(FWY)xxD motif